MAGGIARGCVPTNGVAQDGGHTPANRLTEIYNLGQWSINTGQNKVSADQYHVLISRLTFRSYRSLVLFLSEPLTECWFSIGSQAPDHLMSF